MLRSWEAVPSNAKSLSVWWREGVLYLSNGPYETMLGSGKQPVIVLTAKGAVIDWTEGETIR